METIQIYSLLCIDKVISVVMICVIRYAECRGPAAGCIKQRTGNGNGVMMSWMKKARRAKQPLLP